MIPTLPDDIAVPLLHAPAAVRPALAAVFALDVRLGQVARTTREPIVGQMRLAWWRDALTRLDGAPPPAEPLLVALAAVPARGVAGAALAALVDDWEPLVAAPGGTAGMARFAAHGATLFAIAARLLGGDAPVGAGEGWALADLARHAADPRIADDARAAARAALATAFARRWPAPVRPLGMVALFARFDVERTPAAGRALRSIRFRLVGR